LTNVRALLLCTCLIALSATTSKSGQVAMDARSLEHMVRDQSHEAVKHLDWHVWGKKLL
jgi:hypothetical protein